MNAKENNFIMKDTVEYMIKHCSDYALFIDDKKECFIADVYSKFTEGILLSQKEMDWLREIYYELQTR